MAYNKEKYNELRSLEVKRELAIALSNDSLPRLGHRQDPAGHSAQRSFSENVLFGGQASHGFTFGGAGVASSNADDTTDYAKGTRSIRLTTNGNHQQAFIQRTGMTAYSLVDRVIHVWLKVDNYNNGADFRIWAGSGGTWANYYNWSISDDAVVKYFQPGEGVWVRLSLARSKATVTGTPVENALTDFRVVLYDNGVASGGGGMTIRLGGASTVPDGTSSYANGVISLSFDDAIDDQFIEGKSYLDKYGYPGTLYPIIEMIGQAGYCTLDQVRDMHEKSGWEIGLHSLTANAHNQTNAFNALSTNQLLDEVRGSRDWLVDNGFPDPDTLAYPQGLFNQSVISALKPVVTGARTTKSTQLETVPPGNRLKLFTRSLSSADSVATITALVDKAVDNQEWLILTFHQIMSSPPTTGVTPAAFKSIIDHIATKNTAVRTVSEVLATR